MESPVHSVQGSSYPLRPFALCTQPVISIGALFILHRAGHIHYGPCALYTKSVMPIEGPLHSAQGQSYPLFTLYKAGQTH